MIQPDLVVHCGSDSFMAWAWAGLVLDWTVYVEVCQLQPVHCDGLCFSFVFNLEVFKTTLDDLERTLVRTL